MEAKPYLTEIIEMPETNRSEVSAKLTLLGREASQMLDNRQAVKVILRILSDGKLYLD